MWTPEQRKAVGNFGCGRALSDFQWSPLEPLVPPEKPGGRHREVDMRGVLDAIFYVTRTGCQWRHLPPPPHFPPVGTVHGYYRRFIDEGVWEAIRHHLMMAVREQEGRRSQPERRDPRQPEREDDGKATVSFRRRAETGTGHAGGSQARGGERSRRRFDPPGASSAPCSGPSRTRVARRCAVPYGHP